MHIQSFKAGIPPKEATHMKHVEFYRNDTDGNVLVLSGGQAPEKVIYNGQELTHLVAGSVDAAHEKHVPAFQKIDGHLDVTIGSVTHPMEEKHYIEWIALVDEKGVHFHYLKPGEAPQAYFETGDSGEIYAYCNLHGLWKESFCNGDAGSIDGAACSPEFGGCRIHEL